MNIDLLNLPKDVDSLKRIIQYQATSFDTLHQNYTGLESNVSILKKENDLLREQIQHLRATLYSRKSEKSVYHNQDQFSIFNEAEDVVAATHEEAKKEEIEVSTYTRKKGGRRALPEDLPREEVVHDLREEEKVCSCGAALSRIGEESSEKLDIIPAKMRVIKHVRYKYACKQCDGLENGDGAVRIAPVAPQLIPQSIATEGLLAYILVSKYADALPLYRQEKIFARLGVDIASKVK